MGEPRGRHIGKAPAKADTRADPAAPHYTRFRLWPKNEARTHIFRQTGGDPANLKYNPWTASKRVKHDDQGKLPG